MRTLRSCSALAVVTLAALSLSACSDRDDSLAPRALRAAYDGDGVPLVVEADLPIARLVLRVEDERGGREFELVREDKEGLLAGAIDMLPGAKAGIVFSAYDDEGLLTHEGKGTLLTEKEVTPQQEFDLQGVPGADDASVRIGTYRLALTPSVIEGVPGKETRIEAVLLDARGEPHPIEEGLEWVPAEGQKEVGNAIYDWRDWLIDILWIPEKWYMGRIRFCTIVAPVCGKLTVKDPNPVIQVVTGSFHSCALRKSGRVSCWGDNANRQLGTDAAGTSQLAGIVFTAISAGGSHTCGVDENGDARCWGSAFAGELGPGAASSSAYPVVVSGLPDKAAMVTAGGSHSCALLVNGETWCWGDNALGQLGDSSAVAATPVASSATPVRSIGAPTFTTISAGEEHTCGLTAAGVAWCWGSNGDGEAGIDETASDPCGKRPVGYQMFWTNCAASPRQVQTTVAFVGVGSGTRSTCARTAGGTGYCWGSAHGDFTAVGYGNEHIPRTPTMQPSWKFLTAAGHFQCGIDAADMVQCFGETSNGQTGTGGYSSNGVWTVKSPTPVTVVDSWSSVDGGTLHGCGVRGNGYVVACWGDNQYGELGRVTSTTVSASPVSVTASY